MIAFFPVVNLQGHVYIEMSIFFLTPPASSLPSTSLPPPTCETLVKISSHHCHHPACSKPLPSLISAVVPSTLPSTCSSRTSSYAPKLEAVSVALAVVIAQVRKECLKGCVRMWGRELLEGGTWACWWVSVLDCGFWFQVGRYQVGTWVGDNRPESDVHVGGNSVDIQVKWG